VILVEDGAVSVANARRPRRDAAPSPGVGLRDLAARYRVLAGVPIEITDGASTFAVRVPLLPA
jgi:hypothetical protein